ncbi:unnamed protein product [Callosobruchus maculatus]|uniref:Uncharacterized protein n=1 Tax=Callosobruchus maculatus TaxID=64391 RepID=A0A653CWS3_CALMS|nr:unnamed protein product [Callosobruchus maculatus]
MLIIIYQKIKKIAAGGAWRRVASRRVRPFGELPKFAGRPERLPGVRAQLRRHRRRDATLAATPGVPSVVAGTRSTSATRSKRAARRSDARHAPTCRLLLHVTCQRGKVTGYEL